MSFEIIVGVCWLTMQGVYDRPVTAQAGAIITVYPLTKHSTRVLLRGSSHTLLIRNTPTQVLATIRKCKEG